MKKNILTAIFFFSLFATMMAQEKTNAASHQFGITFSNLNNFGINYKFGNEKIRFRATVLSISGYGEKMYGREQDSLEDKQNSFGVGINCGFEKAKPLYKSFFFLWGLELHSALSYYQHDEPGNTYSTKFESLRVSSGINAIVGVEYVLDNHWVFGAELTPGIYYSYAKQKRENNNQTSQEITTNNIGFNITNNSAALSIAFRF